MASRLAVSGPPAQGVEEATRRRTDALVSRNPPSASSATEAQGNEVAYGPISRNCSSASCVRPRAASTQASRLRTSAGQGSPAGKPAERVIAKSAAASIRSSCTDVVRPAAPASLSRANAARTGSACTRESGAESSAARSAKSKHSRCEPYQAAERYRSAATWQP